MKLRRILIAATTVALLLTCAACTTDTPPPDPTPSPPQTPSPPPPSPTPAATPSAVPTAEETTPFIDGDDFPREKELTIVREGDAEIFIAELKVSDFGYAVYVLPEFDFIPAGNGVECDVIRPAPDSPIMSDFALYIRPSGADAILPEDGPEGDVYREFKLGVFDGFYFEAEFNYPVTTWPSEAMEGAGVMLHAMWETVTR